jgi:hypothetical protein
MAWQYSVRIVRRDPESDSRITTESVPQWTRSVASRFLVVNIRKTVFSQSLAEVNVKQGVRLTEFNSCGEKSPHLVQLLAAIIEFCKPDPNAGNA